MKISQRDFSIEQIFRLVEKNLLQCAQMRGWDEKDDKQFIHLAKADFPLPPFYIAIDDIGNYRVLNILNGVNRFNALLTEKDTTDLDLLSVHFRVNVLVNPTIEDIDLLKRILR